MFDIIPNPAPKTRRIRAGLRESKLGESPEITFWKAVEVKALTPIPKALDMPSVDLTPADKATSLAPVPANWPTTMGSRFFIWSMTPLLPQKPPGTKVLAAFTA